jgi:hypothetical protein
MERDKYILENKIRELIFDDNKNSTHFEYDEVEDGRKNIKLITLNRKTGATFLLTESTKNNEIDALIDIHDFLTVNDFAHTFTIKWYTKGVPSDRPNTSKFTGRTMYEALDKFYFGKNRNSLIIYSISDDNIKSKSYEG